MDNAPHNNTEAQQLGHSGDLGLEQPGTVFDNTTLPEAFDKHLTDTDGNVIVPDNAAEVVTSEKETSVETPKKRGKIYAIGAAALATIAGVSLAIGLNLPKGDQDGTAPTPDDKATNQPSESPSPEATTTTPEKAYSAETLRLPESLSAEEAAKMLFEDRMNQIENAGKSDDFKSAFEKASHDSADGEVAYAKEVAAKNSEVLTDALFVPDWENNTHLVNSAKDLELTNYATISLWAWTYHPDPADKPAYPEDKEPYERSQTVDSIETVSQTETSASFNVTFTMHDNRSENGAAKLTDQPDPNGQKILAAVQLQKIDGSWKISDLTFRAL